MLSGFDFPVAGTVELEGDDITSWSPHRRGRAGLARTFQHSRSFAALSVRENVEVAALGSGARPREARRRAARLLELLGLAAPRGSRPAASPHGDERKLGVARALATEPRFLLLDEPAAGLPEAEVPEFAAVVRSVRDEHEAGVLLIDHNMALVMDVCDRIQVLDQGATLAEGARPRSAPTSTSRPRTSARRRWPRSDAQRARARRRRGALRRGRRPSAG